MTWSIYEPSTMRKKRKQRQSNLHHSRQTQKNLHDLKPNFVMQKKKKNKIIRNNQFKPLGISDKNNSTLNQSIVGFFSHILYALGEMVCIIEEAFKCTLFLTVSFVVHYHVHHWKVAHESKAVKWTFIFYSLEIHSSGSASIDKFCDECEIMQK